MKVVIEHQYVYGGHIYGGAEKRLHFLGKALSELGIDVTYITSRLHGIRKLTIAGVKYVPLWPPVKAYSSLVGARESYIFSFVASKLLRKLQFDVLHTTGGLFYALQKNRRPIVLELYDMEFVYGTTPMKRAYYCLAGYYLFIKHVIERVEAISVEDPVQESKLVNFFKEAKAKIVQVPCGVDLNFVNEVLEGKLKSREDLGFSEDDFILISVNRFYRHKGLNYLIDAFYEVKRQIESAKLVLIGHGPEERNIIKRVKSLGLSDSVMIVKNVSFRELINYYSFSDVYVSPTLMEGTIGSILEAMACGLPIISTSMPWLVRNDVNGYLIPAADSAAITSAVLRLYDKDDRKKFGEMSRKIIKDYDWRIIAKKLLSIYEKLMNRNSP
jgi:glycosyltransferase involved in cell wall biosynthesis